VSRTKTAALIEIPFALRIQVGPENHVSDGNLDPLMGRAILRGKRRQIVNYRDTVYTVICAKTAEPIEMLFGVWTRMGRRNRVLDGVQRC